MNKKLIALKNILARKKLASNIKTFDGKSLSLNNFRRDIVFIEYINSKYVITIPQGSLGENLNDKYKKFKTLKGVVRWFERGCEV